MAFELPSGAHDAIAGRISQLICVETIAVGILNLIHQVGRLLGVGRQQV